MGKSTPSPPPAPDPEKTAAAQSAANKQTAIAQARLNQTDEITPFGTSIYSPTGENRDGIDIYQRTTTLNPEEQKILDAQRRVGQSLYGLGEDQLGRIGQSFNTPFSYEGMPTAPSLTTGDLERSRVEEALYSRLEPQFDRDRRALETQLVNQGFTPGTAGYNQAIDELNRAKTDARMQTTLYGGQEQSRMFGLAANERERAIQEAMTQRNLPLNELSALLGTSPGINVPQFSAPPQTGVAPTDVIGPYNTQYQGQLLGWQNSQGANQALQGQLFGLGGSAMGSILGAQSTPWIFSSDARLKTHIRKIGRLVNGLAVYSFRYALGGAERIGVMAHEVAWVRPEAIVPVGPVLAVDYRLAMD